MATNNEQVQRETQMNLLLSTLMELIDRYNLGDANVRFNRSSTFCLPGHDTFDDPFNELKYIHALYCDIDTKYGLDCFFSDDEFTTVMVLQFHSVSASITSMLGAISPDVGDLRFMIEITRHFLDLWDYVVEEGLIFVGFGAADDNGEDYDSDYEEALQAYRERLGFDDDDSEDGYVKDLTRDGVEPNPGPIMSKFQITPTTKRERKRAALEQKEYVKMLADRQNRNHKMVLNPDYEYSTPTTFAQVGAEYITPEDDKQEPPPDCARCGKQHCNCMAKRVAIAASALSMISSMVKIVEALLEYNKAQIWSYIFPSSQTTELIDNANAALKSIPTKDDLTKGIAEVVNGFMDSQCGLIPITVRTLFKALASAVVVYTLFKLGMLAREIAMVVVSLLVPSEASPVTSAFNDIMSIDGRGFAQVGEPDVMNPQTIGAIIPNVLAIVFSALTAFAVGNIPGKDNTPASWLHKIAVFPRACKSIQDVYKYFVTALGDVWRLFQIKVLGYDATLLEEVIPEIKEWLTAVEMYSYTDNLQTVVKTRSGRYKAVHLYQVGNTLLVRYANALTPEYKAAVQRGLRQAAQIKTFVEDNFPEMKNIRSSPVMLWLVGDSQIGKSRLQYLIHTEMCLNAGIDDPAEIKRQMYMRCVEQEFWDGYAHQYTVVDDDAFQVKDSTSNPSKSPMEYIRMINPFPYSLHMASLTQKANTVFDSKLVIASSNRRDIHIESLTYDEALWNRFATQSWQVSVKPQFLRDEIGPNGELIGTLNLEKVRADRPGWEINPYIFDFHQFNPRYRNDANGGNTGNILGWDAFIAQLKRQATGFDTAGTELDNWLTKYIAERPRNVAQVGVMPTIPETPPKTEAIAEVFAQVGHGFNVGGHTMGSFAKWIESLAVDPLHNPPRETMLTVYNAYVREEMLDLGVGAETTNLMGHVPSMTPPDMWELLMIAYFRSHDTIKNKVAEILRKCKLAIELQWLAIPDIVKEILKMGRRIIEPIVKVTAGLLWDNKILLSFLGLLWLIKNRKSGGRAESYTAANQPRARATIRVANRVKPVKSQAFAEVATAEVGRSAGQTTMIEKVRRQQYIMLAGYADGEQKLGCVTNVVGSIFMMPKHFLWFLEEEPPVSIILHHIDGEGIRVERDYNSFFEDHCMFQTDNGEDLDLMLFSVKNFVRGKDIMKHFATEEDLAKLHNRKVYATLSGLSYVEESKRVIYTNDGGYVDVLSEKFVDYSLPTHSNRTVVATSIASYNIATHFGDCGKLLSVNTDKLSGRIIGMHISGDPTKANFAQLFSRECIQRAVLCFGAWAQVGCVTPSVIDTEDGKLDSGFIHVGQLKDHVPQSSKTSIKKSKLHGLIQEPITKPALLKPALIDGKMHDPLVEGAKKAGLPCKYIPDVFLDVAVQDMYITLKTNHREDPPEMRVLTYEEAIAGIPGDELYQPINRTTSPGYPYMTHAKPLGKKGKTNWIGKHDYDYTSEQALALRNDVEELERKCANNEPFEILWIDTLKDERRSIEKVEAGKTRIISNGPMHYNILFRKYFMSALAHIRHNRIYNGVSVGINVWSREWDFLARYMTANSELMIDGDFASFDGTIMDQVMWSIFEILDKLYNDEHTTIRRNLWYHAAYAMRVCRGTVYQCTHSLPSGFVATAEANSLYVNILFRVVYMHLAAQQKIEYSMTKFHDLVRVVAYGDDNLVSISPEIIDWFNMHTVVGAMKVFGMTYTPADKSSVYPAHKTIDQVSFLKRSFHYVDGKHGRTMVRMCPADLESRLEMTNWTREGTVDSNPEEAAVVTEVLKELTMHGKKVYDTYAPKIVEAAIAQGLVGFRDEGLNFYHNVVALGQSVPRRCDLAKTIQNSDVNKSHGNAICGSGGDIYPYRLGSPEAAPHYPRQRQCVDESKCAHH